MFEDMENDDKSVDSRTRPEEEDEVIVNENFDPSVAVDDSDKSSAPLFIGPLSFENGGDRKPADKNHAENNVDGIKRSEPRSKTKQFSSGLLSQFGRSSGPHGVCLTLSDHDRIRIFIHELAIRGLIPFIEKSMRYLYDQVSLLVASLTKHI